MSSSDDANLMPVQVEPPAAPEPAESTPELTGNENMTYLPTLINF